MKKVFSILLAMSLMLSLVGCGLTGGNDIYAKDGYGEGEMGSVMHTYFFNYTVNSAYTCAEYEGYEPAEGNELLVAEVTVKNTTRDEIEMYDTDFQVQWGSDGEDDYDYPITLYVDPVSDDQLPGEYDLEAGETRTGLLVYEVPKNVEEYSISYLEEFADNTEGDTFFVYFKANAQ
ncbi:MAG: DUF4352 domain-containing protein [Roseburia sp.]